VETNQKKRLEEVLQDLEGSESGNWKKIIEQNREEFEKIKEEIKKNQKELTKLVSKRNTLRITNEEFETQTAKIQQDLYDLESKILKLRLQSGK